MKETNKEIIVNHKAAELYSIVLDVEKYPDYIPWCTKIEILVKGKKQMKANMIVDYKLFPSQKFKSNVFFDSKSLTIKTRYIEGPLKNLNTIWNFIELKNIALSKGFLIIASSPLTRSSYHADEDFSKMRKLREKQSQCHQLQ